MFQTFSTLRSPHLRFPTCFLSFTSFLSLNDVSMEMMKFLHNKSKVYEEYLASHAMVFLLPSDVWGHPGQNLRKADASCAPIGCLVNERQKNIQVVLIMT